MTPKSTSINEVTNDKINVYVNIEQWCLFNMPINNHRAWEKQFNLQLPIAY